MKEIIAIIRYTFKENIRNKTFYVLLLFTIILLFISTLLSVLGGGESIRILYDFGLVIIEFFALLIIVFSGVNLLLEEMDSKALYLILTRPIPKEYYLLGRYFGLLYSVILSMIFMSIIHIILLLYTGWEPNFSYFVSIFFSGLKITIIGALAVFFSLFSTSRVSALVFTLFIWLLGHFNQEIKFLIDKISSTILQIVMRLLYYIIPNLQFFNFRELSDSGIVFSKIILNVLIYGISYSCICIIFSILLFKYKEF